jgi:hypothetical protein
MHSLLLASTSWLENVCYLAGGKGKGNMPSPPPPLWQNLKKLDFLVYFRIFVIFIWNYHYSTQLNRTKVGIKYKYEQVSSLVIF